jgi:hypothetical protein
MSELNNVIEARLAAAEAGVAAAPVITNGDDEPPNPKSGDIWITTGDEVKIRIGSIWAHVDIEIS